MNIHRITALALGAALLTAAAPAALAQHAHHHAAATSEGLAAAVAAQTRTPANAARDKYRHPAETLAFFGVEPDDTVVEIWPGGGWYTEILAPLVAKKGVYYAAAGGRRSTGVEKLKAEKPELYGKIRIADFPAAEGGVKVPDGSADVVLTFRNVHNMLMAETPFADQAFKQAYAMLKPGGVFGIVDHRLPESADSARERSSGYLKVSTVRKLAEDAGFTFAGASEVNANPKDTADWKDGVWTLPPTLRLGDVDRDKYLAIGESDRMTLKFVKPK